MARAGDGELEPRTIQRRVLLSFGATVLATVILCAGYLSVRAGSGVGSPGNPPLKIPPPAAQPPVTTVRRDRSTTVAAQKRPVATVQLPEQPLPGETYLQIAALERDRAEVFVKALRGNGFRVVVASGPAEDIFRVLVGPLEDAALARTQADLQAIGFTAFPRKYRAQ